MRKFIQEWKELTKDKELNWANIFLLLGYISGIITVCLVAFK